MRKEMLEKIKRVGEIVGEKYLAEFSYQYSIENDYVDMIFYDGAFVNTVAIKNKTFAENDSSYCVACVFNALCDEDYVETREISDAEEKVVYALLKTVIFDNYLWIDYKDGVLHISYDDEMIDIDLTDIKLIKLVEESIDNDLYIEFRDNYDGEKYIITGCEGYAELKVIESEDDLEGYCGLCDVKEMNNYIDYLCEELERLKQENKELKEHDIREVTKRLQEQLKEYEFRNSLGNFIKGVW